MGKTSQAIWMISKLPSFSGVRQSVKNGEAYYLPESIAREPIENPIHFVCKRFDTNQMDGIPDFVKASRYGCFLTRNFFGCSLYFGQIVLFGPDFEVNRSVDISDWRPLSWEFKNRIATCPEYSAFKLGVINGYSKQYSLWMTTKENVVVYEEGGMRLTSFGNVDFEHLIAHYENLVGVQVPVEDDGRYDEVVRDFLVGYGSQYYE